MEFRLTYEGPLKAAAGVSEKHTLRRDFHEQLRVLWKQVPLSGYSSLLSSPPLEGEVSIIQELGPYKFAPLVCERLHLICEIDVVLLRPEAPGSVITQCGDIDNRLKTLFDSLRMPKNASEIPPNGSPDKGITPFFCLLEDDNLITKVSVVTDRLLRENFNQNDVSLVIHVVTKAVKAIWANIGLG